MATAKVPTSAMGYVYNSEAILTAQNTVVFYKRGMAEHGFNQNRILSTIISPDGKSAAKAFVGTDFHGVVTLTADGTIGIDVFYNDGGEVQYGPVPATWVNFV